jgi:amylosucrase
MVLLWSTLATRQVALLTHALHRLPPTPPGATWLTYIRNHDDIGWAVSDEDAAAVGENGFLHRQFLNSFYSGEFPGSFARGRRFQFNPVTQDARISGSAASLAGLERALDLNDPHEIDMAIRRLLLLHSVIMVYGGIPLLYMGDELGLPNDYQFAAEPAHASDNRWLHRPRMDWQRAEQRHTAQTIGGRIFAGIRQLIAARAATPALHGANRTQPLWSNHPHVFALARQSERGHLLLLANVHEQPQRIGAEIIGYAGLHGPVRNVLASTRAQLPISDGYIALEGYETLWLIHN